MSSPENIREEVRQRYAAAASRSAAGDRNHTRAVQASCCVAAPVATTDDRAGGVETSCCGAADVATTEPPAGAGAAECCGASPVATTDQQGRAVFGAELYGPDATQGAPDAAVALAASLGCGVPTAVADLHPGEVVLDLGSGAGGDVLISAGRVAPGGRAIGLDMTDEMLDLARRHAAEAGVDNVEFLKGYLEDIPLPDQSVDVVISNCVINLAADKNVVLAEAARVLRADGRLAFSDVIADEDMDENTKADMAQWTGCIAGALTRSEFTDALTAAGFTDIEIRPTHRVHAHAQAAIIRASHPGAKPTTKGIPMTTTIEVFDPAMCCSTGVCGPSVDPELARFEADLRWLAAQGPSVTRYNLAQEPGEFAARPVVTALLKFGGEDVLPIILMDSEVASTGCYPSRTELGGWAGLDHATENSAASLVSTELITELAAVGAAVGSNCGPCLKDHYRKARDLGLSNEQLAVAVRTAQAVKDAPATTMLDLSAKLLQVEVSALKAPTPANTATPGSAAESTAAESSCCGGQAPGVAQSVQIGAAPTVNSCC